MAVMDVFALVILEVVGNDNELGQISVVCDHLFGAPRVRQSRSLQVGADS
jgi:hypothetical protein